MEDNTIANIFYPKSLVKQEGIIIGFNVRFFICVIEIVKTINVDQLLSILNSKSIASYKQFCQEDLIILGYSSSSQSSLQKTSHPKSINPEEISQDNLQLEKYHSKIREIKQLGDMWLNIEFSINGSLRLKNLRCCGYKYDVNYNFILYDKQYSKYVSYAPINFKLLYHYCQTLTQQTQYPKQILENSKPKEWIPFVEIDEHCCDLSIIFRQINLRDSIQQSLAQQFHQNRVVISHHPHKWIDSAQQKRNYNFFWKLILKVILIILIFFKTILNLLLITVNWKIPFFKKNIRSNTVIVNIYYNMEETCQSIDSVFKILEKAAYAHQMEQSQNEQFNYEQSFKLKIISLSSQIKVWDNIVKIFLDLILGFIVLIIVSSYSTQILKTVHDSVQILHIEELRSNIDWLMGFPSGFKPNLELDRFVGNLILKIFEFWNHFTTFGTILEPYIIKTIGLIGFLGFTFQMAIISDILTLCTLHLYYIYSWISFFYNIILGIISTLIKLFRGKKYNVIKKRVATSYFKLDELILGVLIFVLGICLLPTIALFYFTFVYINFAIILLKFIFELILEIVKNFPSYLIFKYLTVPNFLPNSFHLEISEGKSQKKYSTLLLKSHPLPIPSLMFKFKQEISDVTKAMSPGKLITNSIKGIPLYYTIQMIVFFMIFNTYKDSKKFDQESISQSTFDFERFKQNLSIIFSSKKQKTE